MTQLTNEEFKLQTDALFPTNGVGAISAEDLRTQMDNIPDSVPFKTTGATTAPTANDDGANTSGNGTIEVGDLWIDETADLAYICVDNTATAAVWLNMTASGGGSSLPSIIAQTDTRNLALSDAGNIIEWTTTGGPFQVLVIPTNLSVAFPIGTIINVTLISSGATNNAITAEIGVELNGVIAGSVNIDDTQQYPGITLYKRDTDSWVIQGATSGDVT